MPSDHSRKLKDDTYEDFISKCNNSFTLFILVKIKVVP